MACDGTSLAGSRLIVEDIPLVIYCGACDARRSVDPNQWFSCSVCGAPTPEIVQGKELEVSALEIED
jgi:hydrogenase nickel incorporation protein HypA/HybF